MPASTTPSANDSPTWKRILASWDGFPLTRSPTNSSYYDCHGVVNHENDPKARDWHYARDVRAQIKATGTPAKVPVDPELRYPSYFGNRPPLPLSVSGKLLHVPIRPGTSKPWKYPDRLGTHRAVYNPKDKSKVDVIYHDPRKEPS